MLRRLIVLPALLLTSCASLNVTRNEAIPSDSSKTEFQMHSFLWGFIPGRKIPPASVLCPGGKVEAVQFEMNRNDVLLTAVTLGVYVPHRATAACSK